MGGAALASATPARLEAPQRAPLVQREPSHAPAPPVQREAPADDSDSGVELVIPPLPSPPSLIVGWRFLRLHSETPGGRVTEIKGVVAAALEPSDKLQHGWRYRVRFDSDGSEVNVLWQTLQPWLQQPTPADGAGQQRPASHAAAPAPAAGAGGLQPARRRYKGVSKYQGMFRMSHIVDGKQTWAPGFRSAEAAARAYDESRRRLGKRVVNFPRSGADEVQAVPYVAEQTTLRRVEGDAGQSPAPEQRAPRPKAAKEAAVETALHTPMALRRAPAAASPSPSHDGPLIGRHVRSAFSDGGYCTVWYGVVEAKRNGKYLVRYKDDSTYEMTKDEVQKYTVSPPSAGAAASDERKPAPVRKRSRDDLARARAAAGAAPKRQRAAAPAASSSIEEDSDDDSAAPSEPVEPSPAAAPAAAAAPLGGVDDVEAFLRGIERPPLSCLDAALAALPALSITVAHLAIAREEPEQRGELMKELHITSFGDRMAFTFALRKAELPEA